MKIEERERIQGAIAKIEDHFGNKVDDLQVWSPSKAHTEISGKIMIAGICVDFFRYTWMDTPELKCEDFDIITCMEFMHDDEFPDEPRLEPNMWSREELMA